VILKVDADLFSDKETYRRLSLETVQGQFSGIINYLNNY
jgi:hypothetical protein